MNLNKDKEQQEVETKYIDPEIGIELEINVKKLFEVPANCAFSFYKKQKKIKEFKEEIFPDEQEITVSLEYLIDDITREIVEWEDDD